MKYLRLTYSLHFEDVPIWGNPPAFVFRSILGLSLKRLTCILRQQNTCLDCMVKNSCVYSNFFETNIEKDSLSLKGRNKGAHPFVLEVQKLDDKGAVIEVVFIGRAVNYIPYINIALENAGRSGVGRNRVRYRIDQTLIGNEPFQIEHIKDNCIEWPSNNGLKRQPSSIILESPCRIKRQGHYISEIQLDDLLNSIIKRMKILTELFSEKNFSLFPYSGASIVSEAKNQKWVEQSYYSGRQHTLMKLGGVVGEIKVNAILSEEVLQYIEAMELFHVGKNISFGLGKVKVIYDEG